PYNYLQVSGGTHIRPTAPSVKGIYLGHASTTSYGIEMTAPDDTTTDFSTLGTNYKGRIQYNNTDNTFFHQIFCIGLYGYNRFCNRVQSYNDGKYNS
ncbi:MAG: hypothetical protein ACKPKO_52325, partial [Candidatus Fonsibacter sp.]